MQKALDLQQADSVEELRQLEGDRLDALQSAVWEKAVDGGPKAVDQCLKIIDRRVKLFGLIPDGQPGGRRKAGVPVVLDSFWVHVREVHDGDYTLCSSHRAGCPGHQHPD